MGPPGQDGLRSWHSLPGSHHDKRAHSVQVRGAPGGLTALESHGGALPTSSCNREGTTTSDCGTPVEDMDHTSHCSQTRFSAACSRSVSDQELAEGTGLTVSLNQHVCHKPGSRGSSTGEYMRTTRSHSHGCVQQVKSPLLLAKKPRRSSLADFPDKEFSRRDTLPCMSGAGTSLVGDRLIQSSPNVNKMV